MAPPFNAIKPHIYLFVNTLGLALAAQGIQTDNMEGRTNPEVRPTAGTAVRLETGQDVRETTADPQGISVWAWLEWEYPGDPVVYQSPEFSNFYPWSHPGFYPGSYTRIYSFPFDWPIPPADLVMGYGRFTVRTYPELPDLHGCTTVKCPMLESIAYLSQNPTTGVWMFYVPPDFPYRFLVFPGILLEFEVTINHPALEQEHRVMLPVSVSSAFVL